jgi:enamine deaminase RidA (YjgF/YER057c/UK114 family)
VSDQSDPGPEEVLAELGYALPEVPPVAGLYLPAVRAGDLVFTSGAVPMRDGAVVIRGKVGAEVSLEQAQDAARLAVVNALASLRSETGSLRRVLRMVRLVGYVASAPGFTDQPQVLNAASQLLIDLFGDAGRSARSAIGVAELPLGVPVEVELVALVR